MNKVFFLSNFTQFTDFREILGEQLGARALTTVLLR